MNYALGNDYENYYVFSKSIPQYVFKFTNLGWKKYNKKETL